MVLMDLTGAAPALPEWHQSASGDTLMMSVIQDMNGSHVDAGLTEDIRECKCKRNMEVPCSLY